MLRCNEARHRPQRHSSFGRTKMRERRRRRRMMRDGGGAYYTIVRPLIRLAHRVPAGQFVSGLRSCQSKATSSLQAVATEHLSRGVGRSDGGTLPCVDHHRLLTRMQRLGRILDAHAGRKAHVNISSVHVWRGETSRRLRGCSSFLIASPPCVTLIHRRHVEPHRD